MNKCGVYIIRHRATGVFYVGNTKNFRKRQLEHINALKGNYHYAKRLQAEYALDAEMDWTFAECFNKADAIELESVLIKCNKGNPLLCNVSQAGIPESEETRLRKSLAHMGNTHSDATRAKMSASRTGVPHPSPWLAEARRIPVVIDGQTYRSATEAAIAFNVSSKTIANRANSDKFPGWAFA